MPMLHEIQHGVRLAVLGTSRAEIVAAILGEGADAEARLRIHRHNVLASLTEALKANFPVVCAVVHERFFAYAADTFIRAHPPAGPCLSEYGAAFPEFLRSFAPVRHLPYLFDLARLEWAVLRAANAPDAAPIAAESLRHVAVADYPNLALQLDPALLLLRTLSAVERIWAAHQQGEPQEPIDLGTEGARLIVRRRSGGVEVEATDSATFAFIAALRQGRPLSRAGAAALAADPFFDMALALRRLIAEDAITGFAVRPTRNRGDRQP